MVLTGCATPSKIMETWKNGELVSRITEYDNSTFYSGKALGLRIGYNPETYSPTVELRYGRYESARIHKSMWYDSDYGLNDINLLKGEGTAEHHIKMGPVEVFGKLKNE